MSCKIKRGVIEEGGKDEKKGQIERRRGREGKYRRSERVRVVIRKEEEVGKWRERKEEGVMREGERKREGKKEKGERGKRGKERE